MNEILDVDKTQASIQRALSRIQTKDNPPGCDMERYLAQLDAIDMDEDQKRELIRVLWEIMGALVRLQFGLDPTIHALDDQQKK
ncbi:MAG: hypothetical protein ACFB2Z_09175 [Maricaulaceae bacterium]